MDTIWFRGIVTALAPIHHGGDEKTGQETLLRRLKFYDSEKKELFEVPYIDGNAVRGPLRRLIFNDFFAQLGYTIKNIKLYHCFHSGGVLETVDEGESGVLDLALRRQVRALIPPASLLGCSIANQAFSGKIAMVGKVLPICKELNGKLPEQETHSYHDFLDFTFGTRRPEEEARTAREERKEGEQAVQMIYNYEVFIPGTRFYHEFALVDMSEVERSCFTHMLKLWEDRPFLAGRAATGNAKIAFNYKCDHKDMKLDREPYLRFLQENKEQITGLLKRLEEEVLK